jgi:two-component sensor histidine kinase
MGETIKRLCEEYTDLIEAEIQVIQMMAKTLQPLANLEGADIFIDCPCIKGDAIVVAEAKPEDDPSSYNNSVVGMLAKEENEPAVARTLKLGIATKYMKARTQEDKYTIQAVEPIRYNTKVIGVLIRERRITEEENEPQQDRYKAVEVPISRMINDKNWLMESIDDGFLLVDKKGYVIFRNLYAKDLFQKLGYVKDILEQKYKNICLSDYDEKSDLEEYITEVGLGNYFLRIRHIPMKEGGLQLAVIIRDITWNKEQEKSLVLKSVAIKELHHRVKNNLQIIASLLRLQARRTKSEETSRVLYESINRILSISVTHQLLSRNGMEQVSLREVLNTVKNNAVQPFLRPSLKLGLELTGDDIVVDADIATSAALSVNELLQNSMKYAFEGRQEGSIEISINKGKVYSTITVRDDGVGFENDSKRKDSMGLNIVESMVRDKLHGNLNVVSTKQGTKVTFDFINETADLISMTE